MKINNRTSKNSSRWKIIVLIVLIGAACVIGYIVYSKLRTQPQNDTPTSISNTPKPQSDQNISNGDVVSTPSTPEKAPRLASSTTPKAPSGTFVSNHHPNLGGVPAPNVLNSVCITTPGATCTIVFTKDGVNKQLDKKVVDTGGVASWDWSLSQLGLSVGSWKVSARAENGSLVSTTEDSVMLEVAL